MSVKVTDLIKERDDIRHKLSTEVTRFLKDSDEVTLKKIVWDEVTRAYHDDTDSWYACENNFKVAL